MQIGFCPYTKAAREGFLRTRDHSDLNCAGPAQIIVVPKGESLSGTLQTTLVLSGNYTGELR